MDGAYSEWSPFSECNVSCGVGLKIRKRSCNTPEPKNGGRDCSALGPVVESETCNLFPCRTYKWICKKDHVFELLQRKISRYMIDHRNYTHSLSRCEIKAGKQSQLNCLSFAYNCDDHKCLQTAISLGSGGCLLVIETATQWSLYFEVPVILSFPKYV